MTTLRTRRPWTLGAFVIVAVLATALLTSSRLRADAPEFDSDLSGIGTFTVHSVTTLVSGPQGDYRHSVQVRLASGATPTLTEDRTYTTGTPVTGNLPAGGPITAFLSEHFDPLQ